MHLKRRQFLMGGLGGMLSTLAMATPPKWRPRPRKVAPAQTRGTARNLIFVFLDGAPSHVDTFDLKTGSYTPDILGAETLAGGLRWPSGIMPKLAGMSDKFSIVRSISAVEAVHERAAYHLLTAHRPNPSRASEIPHFEAVMSYSMNGDRKPEDSLPTVMSIGREAINGIFPVEHRGLSLGENGTVVNNFHDFEREDKRFGLLDTLLGNSRGIQDARSDYMRIFDQARNLMNDPTLAALFPRESDDEGENPDDFEETEGASYKRKVDMALRVISTKKGCRVFRLELQGWDHHEEKYNPNALPDLARGLDDSLSYLITELEKLPGEEAGKTMFDETLIVAMGEFGRTTGNLNSSGGRDHYPFVVPAFLAGGGVKGGRIVGASDPSGSFITDTGWSRDRYMGIGDLVATVYSALGIDWTQQFTDTPSGRILEIVDSGLTGNIYEIDSLFV